jgi:hypothetical protein
MWYAHMNNKTGRFEPILLYFCTDVQWFWTRDEAQFVCNQLNSAKDAA